MCLNPLPNLYYHFFNYNLNRNNRSPVLICHTMKASALLWILTKKIVRIFVYKVGSPPRPPCSWRFTLGFSSPKILNVEYLLSLSQGLCEIPAESVGRLRLKYVFTCNGVWWRDTEVSAEPSHVTCQCSSVMGDTDAGCDFSSIFVPTWLVIH